MITLDLSKQVINSNEYKFWNTPLREKYTIDDKCKVIMPNFKPTDMCGYAEEYQEKLFDGIDVAYNEYENGLYVGNEVNPFLMLCNVKPNTETLSVHPDTVLIGNKMKGNPTLRVLEIKAKRCYISAFAFDSCERIEKVVFSDNELVSLANSSFRNLSKLASVEFDDNGEYRLYKQCLSNNPLLTSIKIPPKTEFFGTNVFWNSGIKHVFLPETIKDISGVFSDDIQIYYEGDCSDLIVRKYTYESPDDYSFNFHRGCMSYSTGYDYAKGDRYHSFVTYKEYKALFPDD